MRYVTLVAALCGVLAACSRQTVLTALPPPAADAAATTAVANARRMMTPRFRFTIGVTSVSAQPLERITGLVPPPDLNRQIERRHAIVGPEVAAAVVPPAKFSWHDNGTAGPVRFQRGCGSCWAFATLAAAESSRLIIDNDARDMSEQEVLDCSNAGTCEGGWWAFDHLVAAGAVDEARSPYAATQGRCDPFPNVPRYKAAEWNYVDGTDPKPADIKQAIIQHGPVAVGMVATELFKHYNGGDVFNELPNCTLRPNHAVVIVGWDDNAPGGGAWEIKNSWDTSWGVQGFGWIAYDANRIGYGAAWVRMN